MGLLELSKRRTIRAAVNPMDKSTIISIYPRTVDEIKHTIQPGRFHIDAGSYTKPAILVVGPSSWWKDINEDEPLLEIPNSSIQIADSVVKDYCNGLLACNMNDCMPGMFWVPGPYNTIKEFLEDKTKDERGMVKGDSNKIRLENANVKQLKYFHALVRLADGLWARTNGNPLVVSEDMRIAARELNLTNKEWMKEFTAMDKINCKACGSMLNPAYPVCPTCKAIVDPSRAKELGIQFAQ